MTRGDLNGGRLEIEELLAEIFRDAEFRQTGARFLREVISHLHVDVVRRDGLFARPAFMNDLRQLFRNIPTEAVVPTVVEPARQLPAGVMIEHVYIQFALLRQSGESQIAAPEKTNDRVDGVLAMEQIEFGMQRMAQKQLNDDFPSAELRGQSAQGRFVLIGWNPNSQLRPEIISQSLLVP